MKPDKIIINRDKEGKLHHSYWTTDQKLIPFEDTEYIRKDVLLEWAKETYLNENASAIRKVCYKQVEAILDKWFTAS